MALELMLVLQVREVRWNSLFLARFLDQSKFRSRYPRLVVTPPYQVLIPLGSISASGNIIQPNY